RVFEYVYKLAAYAIQQNDESIFYDRITPIQQRLLDLAEANKTAENKVDLQAEMNRALDDNPIPGDLSNPYLSYANEMIADYRRAESLDGPNLVGSTCKNIERLEGTYRFINYVGK